MSSVLFDSPVNDSQLYFNWMEDLYEGDAVVLPPQEPIGHAGEPEHQEEDCSPVQVAALPAETHSLLTLCDGDNRSKQHSDGRHEFDSDDRLEFVIEDGTSRIARPVRMGGLMIRLLKRYGITDDEIAEGLANYASRQERQLAS